MVKYTIDNIGCYGDGGCGHAHVRERLAGIISCLLDLNVRNIREALYAEPSDDLWEEDAALDYANDELCDDNVCFTFYNGDLMLVSNEEEEV